MTRKDYVLIAAALRAARPPGTALLARCHQADCDALVIADRLAGDNPRFDRERFLKACGVQS